MQTTTIPYLRIYLKNETVTEVCKVHLLLKLEELYFEHNEELGL